MYQITSDCGTKIGVAHETRQAAVAELREMARPCDFFASAPAKVVVRDGAGGRVLAIYKIEKL